MNSPSHATHDVRTMYPTAPADAAPYDYCVTCKVPAEVPAHLAPEACYVCGGAGPHPPGGHAYWSNADAAAYFTAEDAKSSGATWADGVFAEEKPWPEVSQ